MGTRGQEEVEIKYQLLNPAPSFINVLDEARSVILAGGTMSPVSVLNELKQSFGQTLDRFRIFIDA